MKTPVLFLVILLTTSVAYAQSKEQGIGYFSKDWVKVAKPTEAAYYRTVRIKDDSSAYILRDYFVPSGKVYQEIECNALVPTVVFHGSLKRYYQDGVLQEEGQYDQGYANGVFMKYYNNGKPCEQSEYQAGTRNRILQYYTPDGREQIIYNDGVAMGIDSHGGSLYSEAVEKSNVKKTPTSYSYYINFEDTIYAEVEKEAQHPGGLQGLMNHLMKTVQYPPAARSNRIQGSVFTMFIVDEQGKISDVYVVKSAGLELDTEAIRVIRSMKPWQPAFIRGRAVKSRFVLPIKFKLA